MVSEGAKKTSSKLSFALQYSLPVLTTRHGRANHSPWSVMRGAWRSRRSGEKLADCLPTSCHLGRARLEMIHKVLVEKINREKTSGRKKRR